MTLLSPQFSRGIRIKSGSREWRRDILPENLSCFKMSCSHIWVPWWLSWDRMCLQCGRPGFDPWVRKIPWRRERLPTPVSRPGEFHELFSPWGCKESDITKRLSLSLFPLPEIIFFFYYRLF